MFGKKFADGGGYASGLPEARGPVSLNLSAKALQQRDGAHSSLIDARLTITGNLENEGDIRVDGKVQGNVRCKQLIVGTDATIDGDIVAAEVVVRGKVKGVIRAKRVQLQETACVESEIIFEKSVGIDECASFEGQIRRGSWPSPAVAMPIDSPSAANSETTDETGLAAVTCATTLPSGAFERPFSRSKKTQTQQLSIPQLRQGQSSLMGWSGRVSIGRANVDNCLLTSTLRVYWMHGSHRGLRLGEAGDERHGGGELHRVAGQDRLPAERDGKLRLA